MKEYVMGNGAIALGALAAGVNLVAGYPGTPSSEIIETIAAHPSEGWNGLSMKKQPWRLLPVQPTQGRVPWLL